MLNLTKVLLKSGLPALHSMQAGNQLTVQTAVSTFCTSPKSNAV